MVARHIMTREVVTVSPAATVKELARTLIRERISGAPVVDGKGRVVGVVSEADIVANRSRRARDIMTAKVLSVAEETPVEAIAALMTTHRINRLPVLCGEKLVGIVSRADIVGAVASGKHIALHTPIYDL